jgi:hypothetical protein
MGPFWSPSQPVTVASKVMEGNLDLFDIFISFSFLFCESTSSKGKRTISQIWWHYKQSTKLPGNPKRSGKR